MENQPLINTPGLWKHCFPQPKHDGNKYDRGHGIIVGGGWQSTGAAKLAAHAALRVGAGLVSVACDARSLPIYGASFSAVMTKLIEAPIDFSGLIDDPRVKAVLIGPGAGITEHIKTFVLEALHAEKPVVLDADALTIFEGEPYTLFDAFHSSCILTPHEGEFARLFGTLVNNQKDRERRAIHAAKLSGTIIILKGAETVIAAPDGRVTVNKNATPYLATAGSGDVLAGICTGLLAQSMPVFELACAAVWLHAEAGRRFGACLTAEDIAEGVPEIVKEILRDAG